VTPSKDFIHVRGKLTCLALMLEKLAIAGRPG